MISIAQKIEEELLGPLNEVQREAVLHGDGPMLILAGAGSGKTRVITHRIAYLARIRQVYPSGIVAVTFTNKAAQEMRDRLAALMGPMAEQLLVRTFHSLGLYILRREYQAAGLKSNFSVYDDGAQKSLLKTILKEMNVPKGLLTPETVSGRISRARDSLISPEDYEQKNDPYNEYTAKIYGEYIRRLRANNALDYGDLLYEAVRLFENHPGILEKYRKKWSHFLIDEYQDTNRAQYILGKLISGEHKNIVVVGDDDQSIYSWRGANIENILSFESDYPGCRVLRLEENYRSSAPILQAASVVIANNSMRRGKTLFTRKEGGETPVYTLYDSEQEEAEGILSRIRQLKREGYSTRDMAIFYRTNAQSRVFETLLRREGIPHVLVGGFRFFDRKEIKDFMAYLSVVVNPDDSINLERIINVPARGIGETSVEKLRNLAFEEGRPLYETLAESARLPRFRASGELVRLFGKFEAWRRELESGVVPSAIGRRVLKESGYEEALRNEGTPESLSRLENLQEFIGSMQEYEEKNPEGDLSDFLQSLALYTSGSEGDPEEDAMSLMTLHNAKGLEFPVVFFTGFEEGFLPHSLSLEDGNVEEERRLVYVGITRAMERIFLSACRFRRIFGQMQPRLPSPFLDELREVIDTTERFTRSISTPRASGAGGELKKKGSTGLSGSIPGGTKEEFRKGERVFHKTYGEGVVELVEQTMAGQKLAIRFDGEPERTRNFLTAYTPLRKIQ